MPAAAPVIWAVHDHPAQHITEAHHHEEAQLLYASGGVMTVETVRGAWVVPPHRAVWIPPGENHAVIAATPLSLRSIKFDTRQVPGLPRELRVLSVPNLLRELIISLTERAVSYERGSAEARLVDVIVDELRSLEQVPLYLPYPKRENLLRVTERLSDDPGKKMSMEDWAHEAGMSARSFARHFQAETGLTFGQWRQQARLLAALTQLADGATITTTAERLGYESESAFIAMFKRALGTTPGRYFSDRKEI